MGDKLTEVSNLMKQESPVLIVGAPRSGTSILFLTLQQHSSFKSWNCENESKVNLTESNIFRLPYDVYSNPNSSAFAYMLNHQEYYEQLIEIIQPIVQRQRILLGKKHLYKLIPKLPFLPASARVLLWKALGNDRLVQSTFYYAKLSRGMDRIVEKTPQHISLLPEIKATFPQAKLIFMARHPIDVYTSYRRRLHDSLRRGNSKKQLSWLNLSPQSFCQKYTHYATIALQELAVNPRGFLLIRYEDFVKNPHQSLRQILEFLEEPDEADYIATNAGSGNAVANNTASGNTASGNTIQQSSQRARWQDDPILFGGIKQITKEWQSYISQEETIWIEDRLIHIMNGLGYSGYT